MNKKLLSTAVFATILAFTANSAFAQMPPPPEGFDKGGPAPNHKMISPQERQQKITEFETRLKLTDEQKAQIEKNRKSSKKKLEAIRKKEMKLREEKKAILDENKKAFEAILTPEQKEELKKIEAERAAKMKELKEKRAAERKNLETKQVKKAK